MVTRRFNVESLSAGEALWKSREVDREASWRDYRDWSTDDCIPGRRAARLLLHWWATGHDPRRHLLACDACAGVGHRGHTCSHCRGTGRRP